MKFSRFFLVTVFVLLATFGVSLTAYAAETESASDPIFTIVEGAWYHYFPELSSPSNVIADSNPYITENRGVTISGYWTASLESGAQTYHPYDRAFTELPMAPDGEIVTVVHVYSASNFCLGWTDAVNVSKFTAPAPLIPETPEQVIPVVAAPEAVKEAPEAAISAPAPVAALEPLAVAEPVVAEPVTLAAPAPQLVQQPAKQPAQGLAQESATVLLPAPCAEANTPVITSIPFNLVPAPAMVPAIAPAIMLALAIILTLLALGEIVKRLTVPLTSH